MAIELRETLFINLKFDREPHVPDPLTLEILGKVRVKSPQENRRMFTIFLRLESNLDQNQAVSFSVEAVANSGVADDQPIPSREELNDFVKTRALPVLWTMVTQAITQITSVMGMNPLKLPRPNAFDYRLTEENLAGDNQTPAEIGSSE